VKKVQSVAFWVILVYLWVMMILFGAIVMETFMVYPNVFHDPPRSLELGLEFMSVRAPSDFFPPLGFLSSTSGHAATFSYSTVGVTDTWQTRAPRLHRRRAPLGRP